MTALTAKLREMLDRTTKAIEIADSRYYSEALVEKAALARLALAVAEWKCLDCHGKSKITIFGSTFQEATEDIDCITCAPIRDVLETLRKDLEDRTDGR